jgi:hypothetical protein
MPNPSGPSILPLTERILRRLPGPRRLWMLAWATVALLRPIELIVVLSLTGDADRAPNLADVFRTQGLFAYVILVTLWGNATLTARVVALAPALRILAPAETAAAPFGQLTSGRGPIALTAAIVAIATLTTPLDYGWAVAIVDVPFLTIIILPITGFIWTYGVVLTGLDRLGRSRLALDLFPQDRALGLGHVGAAAFTGFWLTFAAAAPLLLVSGQDPATLAIGGVVVVAVTLLFVLSMNRLHAQMRAAKMRYVTMARAYVAAAYEPIRVTGTLATLQEAAPALSAAQALADRADKLLEWPVDERMVTFMTVVVTGVVTSLIVRFVLQAAGI